MPSSDDDERLSALRTFESMKTGVKGLVDGGDKTIPSIFVFPAATSLHRPPPPHLSIPTIDLSLPRQVAIPTLLSAARNWGFFRLVNHCIPLHVLSSAITAVRSFHSLPASERSSYYNRSDGGDVKYYSNVDLFHSTAASWRDTLKLENFAAAAGSIPEVCREELVEWEAAAKSVAKTVLGMLAEGIGLREGEVEKMGLLEWSSMVCHCYPPCPEPEKTMGVVEHTDPSLLTVLLQDKVGGLQVKKEGEDGQWWFVDVDPVPGTILVNAGDLLQILSNNEFKSAAHRVMANSQREDRISIGIFFNPAKNGDADIYGPLPELVSPEKPARFRNFTMSEFIGSFYGDEMGTTLLDRFKASSSSSTAS